MAQVTEYVVAGSPLSMAQLKTALDNMFAAVVTGNRGASAPSNPVEGMIWFDTAGDPVEVLKVYRSAGWRSILDYNNTTGTITPYRNVTGTALASAFALTLLDDADGPAMLTTLGAAAWTATLTNKRITPRITTITTHATPTINTDSCDCVTITAQAEAITSMTTNLSGTPTNFQKLIIRIKDNGTARTIAWGASYQNGSEVLPTTTVSGKTLLVGLIWDSVDSKWTIEARGVRA